MDGLDDGLLLRILVQLAMSGFHRPVPVSLLPGYVEGAPDPRPDKGEWNIDGGTVSCSLVCKRWRRLCLESSLWVFLDIRGPVRSFSWREEALFAQRAPLNVNCGKLASVFACTTLLNAVCESLACLTLDVPESTTFESGISSLREQLAHPRFRSLRALHFRNTLPSAADEPGFFHAKATAGWENASSWPAADVNLQLALRSHRIESLSFRSVFAPPAAIARLGECCGRYLRSLSLVPLTAAQGAAFLGGGGSVGLERLEHLETAWALAPAFLRAVLRSSPRMRRHAVLSLEWSRAPWFAAIADGWVSSLLEGRAGRELARELRARGLFVPPPHVAGAAEHPPELPGSPEEMGAVVFACAQAHADALAEAEDDEFEGERVLELWCFGADSPAERVGEAALAEARALCPGLVVRAPREAPWPHPGDCTSECSGKCTALIDWGLLNYRG